MFEYFTFTAILFREKAWFILVYTHKCTSSCLSRTMNDILVKFDMKGLCITLMDNFDFYPYSSISKPTFRKVTHGFSHVLHALFRKLICNSTLCIILLLKSEICSFYLITRALS